ncbi:MAG: hypothetical protein IPJ94_10900 [Chloroflexi bacterium]|nr:hypothetical protein [Chloroflexota bacterium]
MVADIAFPTTAVRAAGAEVGLSLAYLQVSRCAGVFTCRRQTAVRSEQAAW